MVWPWGRDAENKRLLVENQRRKEERINEVKKLVEQRGDADKWKQILALSFSQLRDSLQSGLYTAQDSLFAYVWKALEVHDKFNCVAQFRIEAFEEAAQLDATFYGTSEKKPPLFGIPFTVKESFSLKGYDCTTGLSAYLNKPMTDECTFITHLRSLGAIPFANTNVPQILLSFMCSNPVWGTTKNPHDPTRTCGGSTGGEACLLAGGGIPFGIGSDVAGSLRIPASFCGIVGFKPTQCRFEVDNIISGLPGRGRLALGYGYMTRCVEDQVPLLSHFFGSTEYRQLVPRHPLIPFNNQTFIATLEKKMRIGYFLEDGFMPPVPGCARVVRETVEKLKAEGHELVHFRVPEPSLAANLLFKNLLPDGGAYFTNLFSNDIVDPYMKEFAMLLKDVRQSQADLDEYVHQFTLLWQELKIDALVCPAFPVPAIGHEYPSRLTTLVFSTGLFNMVDYPAGVVPTGTVTKEDDAMLQDEAQWPTGNNFVLKLTKKAASDAIGLPLSIQVGTLPYEEEKCLAVMRIIEKLWT